MGIGDSNASAVLLINENPLVVHRIRGKKYTTRVVSSRKRGSSSRSLDNDTKFKDIAHVLFFSV